MAAPRRLLLLNGPNLNMLGVREPEIYGHLTLDDIVGKTRQHAETLGFELDARQSNIEGELVTWIQEARTSHAGIIINPAAYTHTSVAIQDALKLTDLPVIELHLSNIFKREGFRHHSYVSPVAHGIICGFGAHGYLLAVDALAHIVGG